MRRRRDPSTELADRLAEAAQAMADVRNAEDELEQRRDGLREALRAAHKAGASYALLGRVVGLTRQRVARIVEVD